MYRFSNVDDPEKSFVREGMSILRRVFGQEDAIGAAVSEHIEPKISFLIEDSAKSYGMNFTNVAITRMIMPEEIEKYVRIVSIIREANSDISYAQAVNAIQLHKGEVKKQIFESETLREAAALVATKFIRA